MLQCPVGDVEAIFKEVELKYIYVEAPSPKLMISSSVFWRQVSLSLLSQVPQSVR